MNIGKYKIAFIISIAFFGCTESATEEKNAVNPNSNIQNNTQTKPQDSAITQLPSKKPLGISSILPYFSLVNADSRALFKKQESALSANLAASGRYSSGDHYLISQENFNESLSYFFTESKKFLTFSSDLYEIKCDTLIKAYDSLIKVDTAFVRSYYSSANWGLKPSALESTIISIQQSTIKSYNEEFGCR